MLPRNKKYNNEIDPINDFPELLDYVYLMRGDIK